MFLKPGVKIGPTDRKKLVLAWWPFSIISFDSCPENMFLVDLVVASESRDPLPIVLTMRRYRDRYRLEPSPPVNAPLIVTKGVGPSQILGSILKIYRDLRDRISAREEIDIRSLRRMATQIRGRRPHTLEEALANPITRGILSEILESICIKTDNVRISSYIPLYTLIGANIVKEEFYIYMERKLRSTNHEVYALKLEGVAAVLNKYQNPGIHGEAIGSDYI
jgi:hypothetical protein